MATRKSQMLVGCPHTAWTLDFLNAFRGVRMIGNRGYTLRWPLSFVTLTTDVSISEGCKRPMNFNFIRSDQYGAGSG